MLKWRLRVSDPPGGMETDRAGLMVDHLLEISGRQQSSLANGTGDSSQMWEYL